MPKHSRPSLASVLLIAFACVLPGAFVQGGELTVKFGDRPIRPAFGSVTGTWFYADAAEKEYSSQMLLLGHNAGVTNGEP
ncbi:MAG: hypothetical protein IJG83_02635 [Thermoguttaceae bacterium]|nr:hypothetical protein [Thermoguttaceae bacterium]